MVQKIKQRGYFLKVTPCLPKQTKSAGIIFLYWPSGLCTLKTFKTINMKTFGIILIIAGIAMLLFRGFSFTQDKKVVDIGPLEINKKEKKSVNWPMYAGIVVTAAGVLVTLGANKKS